MTDENKKDDVIFVKKTHEHLPDRLRLIQRLEFDSEMLSQIPFINIVGPLYKNEIIDYIIKNLPARNDRYYTNTKKG